MKRLVLISNNGQHREAELLCSSSSRFLFSLVLKEGGSVVHPMIVSYSIDRTAQQTGTVTFFARFFGLTGALFSRRSEVVRVQTRGRGGGVAPRVFLCSRFVFDGLTMATMAMAFMCLLYFALALFSRKSAQYHKIQLILTPVIHKRAPAWVLFQHG